MSPMFFSVLCLALLRKRNKTLLHLKIWTLLMHLFDLSHALHEGLFFQLEVYTHLEPTVFLTIDSVNPVLKVSL